MSCPRTRGRLRREMSGESRRSSGGVQFSHREREGGREGERERARERAPYNTQLEEEREAVWFRKEEIWRRRVDWERREWGRRLGEHSSQHAQKVDGRL